MTADFQPPPLGTLAELQWDWGEPYLIAGAAGHWVAQCRDDKRTLAASTPDGLRELIREDYAERPVPREAALMTSWAAPPAPHAYLQAVVLQVAFPEYTVSVLARRDGRPRFQVLSRDGLSNPYCLISDDASEIWDELRRPA